MRRSVVRLITQRETRDLLRDRRTVVLVLVLPVILYPLFGAAGYLIALSITEQKSRIGVVGLANLPAGAAADGKRAVPPLVAGEAFADGLADTLGPDAGPVVVVPLDGDPDEALKSKQVDAVLTVPAGFSDGLGDLKASPGGPPLLGVDIRDGDEKSKLAARRLAVIVRNWEAKVREVRFERAGLPKTADVPFKLDDPQSKKPKEKKAADELRDQFAKVFPFVLMMWLLAGAIQPAVDVTAGEKERGTMETLLISPAERTEIVAGKFLAVTLFAYATVFWNVLWLAGGALLMEQLLGYPILNRWGLLGCLVVAVPLAMFFSAVCLALGVFARSTKEGQYYLMPLFLLTTPLAFASMMPGTELNAGNALIPVTGALLLQQKLLSVTADPVPWAMFGPVLGGLGLSVLVALWLAVRQFHREGVLFRETGPEKKGFLGKLINQP